MITMNLIKDNQFAWIGPKVLAYNRGLTKANNSFYRHFELNGIKYSVGDVVIYNETNNRKNDKICKILVAYESHDDWLKKQPHRGMVRWCREATNDFTLTTGHKLKSNEIVEDYDSSEVFISLEFIHKKCNVHYLNMDGTTMYSNEIDENCSLNYVCRFKCINKKCIPLLENCLNTKIITPERKRPPSASTIIISDSEDEIQIANSLNNVNITSGDKKNGIKHVTPNLKKAKRNLNDSFNNAMSSQENTPTLNYSVIEQEEPLKVKLRLSTTQDPKVILTRLDKKLSDSHLKKLQEKEPKTPEKNKTFYEYKDTPRRSNRNIQRISYADYLSPKKPRSVSVDSEKFTPVKRTPTKRTRNISTCSIEETEKKKLATPHKTVSTPRTPSTRKLLRDGTLTPTMQSRVSSIKTNTTPLMKARAYLHVSYTPDALPCREKEFRDIYNFLKGKLNDGCGGCMYISGVPGTGKTATVTTVIRKLEQETLKDFTYININGMRLTEPKQCYVEILKQINGKTVPWEEAQTLLNNIFTKRKKNSVPIILLVDELDILCTKKQDVVYNLLDWPSRAVTQLIVLTIANTMDLPERLLMGRVTSRLGLTRLTFQPYTYKELQEIVTKRLLGTNAFNPDAVQLVARKVASVSGDARRALDICRRAAEIAEGQGPNTLVSMSHVNDALNAMITQPKVQAIKHCSKLQQLILQSVVAEVERTGVEETNFMDVFTMLRSVCGIHGFQMASVTITVKAISYLAACRLLLTDNKLNDMDQRIILNVSSDDVYYALKSDS